MLEECKLKRGLQFNPDPPDWITEEEINEHAEEGRLWAERIIKAIRQSLRLSIFPLSYVQDEFRTYADCNLNDPYLVQICDRLLERLQPAVFFC